MPSHSMIARYIILIESVFVQWVGSGSFKKSDFSAVIFLILGNRQSASLPSLWTSGIGSAKWGKKLYQFVIQFLGYVSTTASS